MSIRSAAGEYLPEPAAVVAAPIHASGAYPISSPGPEAGSGPFSKRRKKTPRPAVERAEKVRQFEKVVMPHLDAAFNLACWLTRNRVDAQDVVQEAAIRAYMYLDTFAGTNARAWMLVIVRHACFRWMRHKKAETHSLSERHGEESCGWIELPATGKHRDDDPETLLLQQREQQRLRELIASLPPFLREVIVLRELEEASYREIAKTVGIPLGTVMSRLARARSELKRRNDR